jgi:co-chaperonin GroES (HSP10)
MTKITGLAPAGHRILVKPDEVEEVSKGGIILDTRNKDREEHGQCFGTIVGIGPNAWNIHDGEPWAKVGDRVLFARHGGFAIKISGKLHRVMNDEDITAIITGEEL